MTHPENHKTLPPHRRSQAAGGLGVAAAQGRLALQVCQECKTVQYPPRDVCGACLSEKLIWTDSPDGGQLLATTTIRVTGDPYFREMVPWRTGIVRLDCGPSVIAHLHGGCARGDRVRISLKVDQAGNGVIFAMPDIDLPGMFADRQLQQFVCDPRSHAFLVTGADNPAAMALARKLAKAGAARIVLAVDEPSESAKSLQPHGWTEVLEIVSRKYVASNFAVTAAALSVETVITLIETRDDLMRSNVMRDEMRWQRIPVFNIFLGSPDMAAEDIAATAITALRSGIRDTFVGGDARKFLRPSDRWPGLSVYDHKE